MADIGWRSKVRPWASFMRSSSASVGSCQGKSSSICGAAAGVPGAPFARSIPRSPATNPFSQARCDSVNGALSGRNTSCCISGGLRKLRQGEIAQSFRTVALREALKAFFGRSAPFEVGAQEPLDCGGCFIRRDIAQYFAPEPARVAEAAASEQVITLDFGIVGRDLGREQADIADMVLRAGIRAAGEMNVERRVDLEARIEMVGDREGVALGVARRELATGVASAGDDSGANRGDLGAQADRRQGLGRGGAIGYGDVRHDQIGRASCRERG